MTAPTMVRPRIRDRRPKYRKKRFLLPIGFAIVVALCLLVLVLVGDDDEEHTAAVQPQPPSVPATRSPTPTMAIPTSKAGAQVTGNLSHPLRIEDVRRAKPEGGKMTFEVKVHNYGQLAVLNLDYTFYVEREATIVSANRATLPIVRRGETMTFMVVTDQAPYPVDDSYHYVLDLR